jgi:hypothetical protein
MMREKTLSQRNFLYLPLKLMDEGKGARKFFPCSISHFRNDEGKSVENPSSRPHEI